MNSAELAELTAQNVEATVFLWRSQIQSSSLLVQMLIGSFIMTRVSRCFMHRPKLGQSESLKLEASCVDQLSVTHTALSVTVISHKCVLNRLLPVVHVFVSSY